jgi:hypothetical protein
MHIPVQNTIHAHTEKGTCSYRVLHIPIRRRIHIHIGKEICSYTGRGYAYLPKGIYKGYVIEDDTIDMARGLPCVNFQ